MLSLPVLSLINPRQTGSVLHRDAQKPPKQDLMSSLMSLQAACYSARATEYAVEGVVSDPGSYMYMRDDRASQSEPSQTAPPTPRLKEQ